MQESVECDGEATQDRFNEENGETRLIEDNERDMM